MTPAGRSGTVCSSPRIADFPKTLITPGKFAALLSASVAVTAWTSTQESIARFTRTRQIIGRGIIRLSVQKALRRTQSAPSTIDAINPRSAGWLGFPAPVDQHNSDAPSPVVSVGPWCRSCCLNGTSPQNPVTRFCRLDHPRPRTPRRHGSGRPAGETNAIAAADDLHVAFCITPRIAAPPNFPVAYRRLHHRVPRSFRRREQ